MNKNQFNVITDLQSGISTLYKSKSDEIVKQFDSTKDKIIELSDDPKKDGLEICSKLDEIKEAFQTELEPVFEKLEKKLYSL
jgi:hypothetical protein